LLGVVREERTSLVVADVDVLVRRDHEVRLAVERQVDERLGENGVLLVEQGGLLPGSSSTAIWFSSLVGLRVAPAREVVSWNTPTAWNG